MRFVLALALALTLALPAAFNMGAQFGRKPIPEPECPPIWTVALHPPGSELVRSCRYGIVA